VASPVVNFCACSLQGTMDICTVIPGCEASKLLMLALKPLMLGVSVWNSQKVTTCLLLAEAFCATTPPVTANRVAAARPAAENRLDLAHLAVSCARALIIRSSLFVCLGSP